MSNRLRVLIVDDNRDALYLLRQMLGKFACDVRECSDSTQAVPMTREFSPHVIFLDISMPGLDGFEVAEDLHELQLPDFMLVALTSYADEEHRRECRASGFEQFLAKPVSVEQIAGVIEAAKSRFSISGPE